MDEQLNYREAALERFQDAIVLYAARRYSASLYMAGYVIEIGIKHKFVELGKIPLSKITPLSVLYLFESEILNQPLPKYFKDIISLISDIQNKQAGKNVKNLAHVKTLLDTRYASADKKEFHNNHKFLKQLIEWYKVFQHAEVNLLEDFYASQGFSELYPDSGEGTWSTSIRYKVTESHDEENAQKHLKLCTTFLLEILNMTSEKSELEFTLTNEEVDEDVSRIKE
ncbi:MAG: hypothetical protein R3E08_11225 [Thiotrichaceae bacterium]